MKITADHVDALLCLYQTGARIKILSVDDLFVTYQTESGERFSTYDHHFDALPDPNPVRRDIFDFNARLGLALLSAELGALRALVSNPFVSRAEQESAERVLAIVATQKEELSGRIHGEQLQEKPASSFVRFFLDQLYESGTGSHDTFYGQRVENISQFHGHFRIENQTYDYDSASQLLSRSAMLRESAKPALDTQIVNARYHTQPLDSYNQRPAMEQGRTPVR